jgi:8-oxo-dGTP pyrophosphatase MutT (NUDIX family)
MMCRVRTMAFAPGAAVFPGGRIDPGDGDAGAAWSGATPDSFAARMRTDAGTARALVTAAVRELFEETGVLLASPLPVVGLEEARAAVEKRDVSLAQFLDEQGCALDSDAVHPWAHWVTPPAERRRYDTWFFIAALPAGGVARSVSSEADEASWIGVSEALRAYAAGDMRLLPPTVVMLRDLEAAGDVAAALAAAPFRSLAVVHPQVELLPDGSIRLTANGAEFNFPAPR